MAPSDPDSDHGRFRPGPIHPGWPGLIDKWLRDPAIRRTLFIAFLGTLIALVLIVAFGGPLALACLFGPVAGGSGIALWRGIRASHDHA